jgi:hypothetical protein
MNAIERWWDALPYQFQSFLTLLFLINSAMLVTIVWFVFWFHYPAIAESLGSLFPNEGW